MDGSDPEGKARIDEDIAGIAQQLLRLQEAGVPVLLETAPRGIRRLVLVGSKGC